MLQPANAFDQGTDGKDVPSSRPPLTVAGLDFLKRLADGSHPAPPFAAQTDIWIVEAEQGRVLFAATPSKRFYNPLGTVHGGWISTLLDSAMGCAVHSVVGARAGLHDRGYDDQLRTSGIRKDGQAQVRGQDHPHRRTDCDRRRPRVGRGRHAHRPRLRDMSGDDSTSNLIVTRHPLAKRGRRCWNNQ